MSPLPPHAARQRARIASLTRAVRNGERPADDPALDDARREFAVSRIADCITAILEKAPPLTDEQRQQIANLALTTPAGVTQ